MERLRWVVLFFFLFPFFVFSDLAESRVSPKKSAGSKNFPSPPALRDMVDFWKKIFTRYSTSDVVFHDEENLALVYGTLRLDGEWRATRRQRNAIRAYKRRIESILISLSKGDAISSQIASLQIGSEDNTKGNPQVPSGKLPIWSVPSLDYANASERGSFDLVATFLDSKIFFDPTDFPWS